METSEVFELRRQGKLHEALDLARNLYRHDPEDNWTIRALAWPLIDLCKAAINNNDLALALEFFRELVSIKNVADDEIIKKNIKLIEPKLDHNNESIAKADELSKNGDHPAALQVFEDLKASNNFKTLHHESYGWVLYRYVKERESNLDSVEVRKRMRDYMLLENERPSLLHSMFLNFAVNFARNHEDFNLLKFFQLWGAENLREEDKSDSYNGDSHFPSLLSKLVHTLVDKGYAFDIQELANRISDDGWGLSHLDVYDLAREPFFYKIYNAHKEEDYDNLWSNFSRYIDYFKGVPGSNVHSKILSLACHYMVESESYRFIPFFKNWNPSLFLKDDWKETKNKESTFKPLAIQALIKAYDLVINDSDDQGDWLIHLFDQAINKFPDDEWLLRRKGKLLLKLGNYSEAEVIYKKLVLILGDQYYIWHEFASCFKNRDSKKCLALNCKSLLLLKKEDFIGEIRLDIAEVLIQMGEFETAKVELILYKRFRDSKGFQIPIRYSELFDNGSIQSASPDNSDNHSFYEKLIGEADDIAYEDIEWEEVLLIDKFETRDKVKYKFQCSNGEEFTTHSRKEFDKAKLGQLFNMKLYRVEPNSISQPLLPLPVLSRLTKEYNLNIERDIRCLQTTSLAKPLWDILPWSYSYVEYYNHDKGIAHFITNDHKKIFLKDENHRYQVGEFWKGRLLKTFRKRDDKYFDEFQLKNLEKVAPDVGISQFQQYLAVIDSINHKKELYHFVVNSKIDGIIHFDEIDFPVDEGSFVSLHVIIKKNKHNNTSFIKAIGVKPSEESNENLLKNISGFLSLKYKSEYGTNEWGDEFGSDLEIDPMDESHPSWSRIADFGFIAGNDHKDYYVSREIIRKAHIYQNCSVTATVVFGGDKWKTVRLTKIG